VREVPVEKGGLEARVRAVLEAAEVEELLRLGEEDLGVTAENGVQPRGSGALRPDDQEIGKAIERETLALDLAVAQAPPNGTGNQGWSPSNRLARTRSGQYGNFSSLVEAQSLSKSGGARLERVATRASRRRCRAIS
jgi:hypothetical protein